MSTLTALSDTRLFSECFDTITKAAYGSEGAYEHAMELMAESQTRHRRGGHDMTCRADIYSQALAQAQAKQTFQSAPDRTPCSCGAES